MQTSFDIFTAQTPTEGPTAGGSGQSTSNRKPLRAGKRAGRRSQRGSMQRACLGRNSEAFHGVGGNEGLNHLTEYSYASGHDDGVSSARR